MMTAESKRMRTLLIFTLPVLIGFGCGVLLAQKDHSRLQEQWATKWLVKEIERVVPSYWIEPDRVANFNQISTVHQEAMAYWAPFPAVAGASLTSITTGETPGQTTRRGQHLLTFPDSTAIVTTALPSFLGTMQARSGLAIATISCLFLAGLAIRLFPRPYTAAQTTAINGGLPLSALYDPHIERLFKKEIRLPLLARLLSVKESDTDIAVEACTNEDAAKLAQHCLDTGWEVDDVYTILRAARDEPSYPDAIPSDYDWWKLLTATHGQSELEALRNSQKPRLMSLDGESRTTDIRGLSGQVPPKSFALLVYFAQRKKAGKEPLNRPAKAGDPKLKQELAEIYEHLAGSSNKKNVFSQDITGDELGQMISHLNASIKKLIADDQLATFYEVQSEGKKHGEKYYELQCPVEIH
jgi:hypothetical protein